MNSKKEVQHVYLVGAKSLGAYGGYETFVYKLTEYHQNGVILRFVKKARVMKLNTTIKCSKHFLQLRL